MRLSWLLAVVAGIACGDQRRNDAQPQPPPVQPAIADSGVIATAIDAAADPPSAAQPLPIPPDSSELDALRALAAIPAWQAVVNRGNYLARRKQSGIIYGQLGELVAADASPSPAAPYRWLIDETEGSGSLAIRLHAESWDDLAAGQRIVVWGAWHVDAELTWYWRTSRIALLEPGQANPDRNAMVSPSGHQIVELSEPPTDAVAVSEVEAGPVDLLFQVTRIPSDPRAGLEIADRSDWKATARLFLTGERTNYGGQDLRAANERWKLVRGVTYAVRIKRFLPAKPGQLVRLTAIGPPQRVAKGKPR